MVNGSGQMSEAAQSSLGRFLQATILDDEHQYEHQDWPCLPFVLDDASRRMPMLMSVVSLSLLFSSFNFCFFFEEPLGFHFF
jgi:hypothetical protein